MVQLALCSGSWCGTGGQVDIPAVISALSPLCLMGLGESSSCFSPLTPEQSGPKKWGGVGCESRAAGVPSLVPLGATAAESSSPGSGECQTFGFVAGDQHTHGMCLVLGREEGRPHWETLGSTHSAPPLTT